MYNTTFTKPQPFWFEEIFDVEAGKRWMQNYWHLSIYVSALYVTTIFYIQHKMKSRPEFQLQWPLFVWNLLFAVLSIVGTLRMLPGLYHVYRTYGLTFSVCNFDYISTIQPTAFWATLFIGSKIAELGDTVFIVLRKRKLIFIHWYHHVMTLIMCWYTVGSSVAATHWFGVMNYAVHSLMYTYYMLSSVNIRLPRHISMGITLMQLMQMVMGSFACFWAVVSKNRGYPCNFPDRAVNVALSVYVSYVFLFSRLLYSSYLNKTTQGTKPVKNKGQ